MTLSTTRDTTRRIQNLTETKIGTPGGLGSVAL
jgi:hypothetical protein